MSETNNSGDKTLGAVAGETDFAPEAARRTGNRAAELFARAQQGGRRREGQAPRPRTGRGAARARRQPATLAPKAAAPAVAPRGPTAAAPPAPPKTGVVLRTLTEEQREARARALVDARAREEEDRRRQEAEAEVRRERESRERAEREAAEARKREEDLRRSQEASFKRQSEEEARRRLAGGEPAATPATTLGRKPGVVAPAARGRRAERG